MQATEWIDCGADDSVIHFNYVASLPDPVHKGEKQTIEKKVRAINN